jgi:hypothetical protein
VKLGLAVAAALLVTGCSGTSTPVTAPSEARTTPTPAISQATTAQWASTFAASTSDIADTIAKYKATDCEVGYAIGMQDDIQTVSCLALADTLGSEGQILTTALTDAGTPGGPKFIGLPTSEIAPLIVTSETAGQGLASAAASLASCKPCAAQGMTMGFAINTMSSTLAAWKPYGA